MENIAINRIEPNDYNPNVMTEAEFSECKNEVQHLGAIPKSIIVRPVDGKFVIVDGEHNWRAARDLGFDNVPCEIIQMDILEAMRQTYKRNMHGTFNPSKLGKMFERAIKESNLSQRDLAKQYEVSEGTVRNALMYCESYKLRNNYAFDKLTIRQVRLYLALPQGLRDKWLDAGADPKLLLPDKDIRHWEKVTGKKASDDSTFEDIETHFQKWEQPGSDFISLYKAMDEWQLWELVKPKKQEFKQSIARIDAFTNWVGWHFCGGRKALWSQVRPYALLMFDYFDTKDVFGQYEYRGEFEKCFRLIRYKGEFCITPEEAAKVFSDSKVAGCDPGESYKYPQLKYIHAAFQAILLQKGIVDSPVDLNILPDPAEEIMAARISKDGPDYLKQSTLSAIEKGIILDYVQDKTFSKSPPADDEQGKKEAVKLLEQRHHASAYYQPEQSEIRGLLSNCIRHASYQNQIDKTDNQQLAARIIGYTNLYPANEIDKFKTGILEFTENLLKLKREQLLAIYRQLDYQSELRGFREYFKSIGR